MNELPAQSSSCPPPTPPTLLLLPPSLSVSRDEAQLYGGPALQQGLAHPRRQQRLSTQLEAGQARQAGQQAACSRTQSGQRLLTANRRR